MNNTLTLFDPLNRYTVGFDSLFDLLDRGNSTIKYPPYNIEKIDENNWTISLAVAGFRPDDLEVTVENNQLRIFGEIDSDETKEKNYVYKGIASRNFQLSWTLGQHVEVESATCEHGLLNVNLIKRVPEELMPRRIEIKS